MKYNEFLDLSPIEISQYLNDCGIVKIQDINDKEKFLKKTNITDIQEKDFSIWIINNSLSKGYARITFKKVINEDIKINIKLYFSNVYKKSTNINIKVEEVIFEDYNTSSSRIKIFKKIHDLFDNRPDYNNLELYYCPDKGDINRKLSETYEEIINYTKNITPTIQELIKFIDCGSFIKIYNKYNKDKFKYGNMPFLPSIFGLMITDIYLKKFDDFEDYLIYLSLLSSNFKFDGDPKSFFLENKEYCKKHLIDEVIESKKVSEKAELLYKEFENFVGNICKKLEISQSDVHGCIFYKQICKNLERK